MLLHPATKALIRFFTVVIIAYITALLCDRFITQYSYPVALILAIIIFIIAISREKHILFLYSYIIIASLFGVAFIDDTYRRITSTLVYHYTPLKHTARDSELGFKAKPIPKVRGTASRRADSLTIYDVIYHRDKNGLRLTPGSTPSANTLLFYGGSFTYGSGVNDNETLPASLLQHTEKKYNVANMAFHAYGPAQMLRSVELGHEEDYIQGDVSAIFYQFISGHIRRVTGTFHYASNGPNYIIDHGKLRYSGQLHNPFSLIPLIKKSGLYASNAPRLFPDNMDDVTLTIEVIKRSHDLLHQRYNNVPFYILLWWDYNHPHMQVIFDQLSSEFNVINVSDLMTYDPKTEDWSEKYLIANDGHPTPYAYQVIAKHLAQCCI